MPQTQQKSPQEYERVFFFCEWEVQWIASASVVVSLDRAVQRLHSCWRHFWIATHAAARTPMLTLAFKKSTTPVNLPNSHQLRLTLVNFVRWMRSSHVGDTLLWPPVSLILAANDTGCLALWAERRICGLSFWGEKSAKPCKRLWIKVLSCVFVCVWWSVCVSSASHQGFIQKAAKPISN